MLKRWTLLSKEKVFDSRWLGVEKRAYKLPSGKVVDDYYHLTRADYVLIVAVAEDGKILLERQYRRGVDDFVYELPAGYIGKGEKPLDAAIRELREETGWEGTGKIVGEVYAQPGMSSLKAYVAILKIKGFNKAKIKRDDDETMQVESQSWESVRKMISQNRIKDMGALSALAMYEAINEA